MRKIRVLQVGKLYYPEVGGVEKILQQLAEGLSRCPDLEVEVLACQKKGTGTDETVHDVTVHRAGSIGTVASVPVSFSFIRQFIRIADTFDIIHIHMPFPLADLACLLSGYRGKVVVYWHSDVVKQKKWMVLYRPVMNRFLRRTDVILAAAEGIVAGSRYLRPYIRKCRIVPFSVEGQVLANGREAMKRQQNRWEDTAGATEFLFIGRLVYYKGCGVLLDACRRLQNNFHLTIIGSGPLEDELKKQCTDLGLTAQVDFLGYRPDDEKYQYLSQADVLVLPSVERSEAFGLVQMEAMAYGVPVINTRLPSGVPEVSIHGQTGLTVKPDDPKGLADAMDWMAEHVRERRIMGTRARKRVEETYTQEKMIENVIQIYRKLCGDT